MLNIMFACGLLWVYDKELLLILEKKDKHIYGSNWKFQLVDRLLAFLLEVTHIVVGVIST